VELAVGESRLHFSFPAAQTLPAAGQPLTVYLPAGAIQALPAEPASQAAAHA